MHILFALQTLFSLWMLVDAVKRGAESYWESDRQDDALELARVLCRKSQRIGPRVLYATYLMALECDEEARGLLERGLVTFRSSPAYVRRRDRADARAAKALLGEL